NDGVAVVVFIGLLRIAGIGGPTASSPTEDDLTSEIVHHATSMGELFLVEVGGGVLLGLGLGYLLVALLGSIDDYKTEVLLTLAGVTGGYVLCTYRPFSGPLAMVIAGLFIGHRGRRSALSDESVRRLDEFWELIDEILNAVLFVLIGLEVLVITLKPSFLVAGFAVVPLALLGRFVTVAGMAALLKGTQEFTPGATRLLAWAGLRGGVSVALALSLKGKLPPDLSGVGGEEPVKLGFLRGFREPTCPPPLRKVDPHGYSSIRARDSPHGAGDRPRRVGESSARGPDSFRGGGESGPGAGDSSARRRGSIAPRRGSTARRGGSIAPRRGSTEISHFRPKSPLLGWRSRI